MSNSRWFRVAPLSQLVIGVPALLMGIRVVLLVICFVCGSGSMAVANGALDHELRALDGMRRGMNTPVDEVEARGKEMLAQYTKPKERAVVYYQLAHVHAQSGLTRPDLIVRYSQKALHLPLTPEKRLQLFIYYGDALQVMNRTLPKSDHQAFPKIRRKATGIYLQGLQDSIRHDLPERKPVLPVRVRGPIEMPVGDAEDLEFQWKVAKLRIENEVFEIQRQQARLDQAAWENRRILYDQIVYLYLRVPEDDKELRSLATQALPAEMVTFLFNRLEEKSSMRQKPPGTAMATAVPEPKPGAP